MTRRFWSWAIAGVLGLAACSGSTPYRTEFDASAGEVEVTALGDGFVLTLDGRVPLEAAILTLRQRTRAMSADALLRFVVHLNAAPVDAPDAPARAGADLDRLLGELQIMGVRQIRYL